MLKKKLKEQLDNSNHYTIPKYVLTYSKQENLDRNSLILLIYFLNKENKEIFDYRRIITDLEFSEKELLDSISTLKNKKLLAIEMQKNDLGILEERVNIESFYDIIFSNILTEKEAEEKQTDLFQNFESEFGRTLSPIEYEIINSWLSSGISKELILAALKEAVFNGVNNLRYIDKIIYEWNKKGIKKATDINKKIIRDEEEKEQETFEYDWLNDND